MFPVISALSVRGVSHYQTMRGKSLCPSRNRTCRFPTSGSSSQLTRHATERKNCGRFLPACPVDSRRLIPVQAVVTTPEKLRVQQMFETCELHFAVSPGMSGYERQFQPRFTGYCVRHSRISSLCTETPSPSSGLPSSAGIAPPTPLLWGGPTTAASYPLPAFSASRRLLNGTPQFSQVPT